MITREEAFEFLRQMNQGIWIGSRQIMPREILDYFVKQETRLVKLATVLADKVDI